MKKGIISVFVLLAFIGYNNAQETEVIQLVNGSFEDSPRQGGVGYNGITGWYDCGALRYEGETPPDIHPGDFWENVLPASEGSTYLGMVVRDNDTYEGVSQRLSSPLTVGKCYSFSVELARSPQYKSQSRITYKEKNYVTPSVLRVWGGSGFCGDKELLAESSAVDHSAWKTYEFEFEPRFNHRYLLVEAYYKVPILNPYCGHILVDNLSDLVMKSCDGEEVIAVVETVVNKEPALPPHKRARIENARKKAQENVEIQVATAPTKPKILEELDIKKLRKGSIIEIKNLYFSADTSKINTSSFDVLDEIYSFLNRHKNVSLEIGGHTNGIPPHSYCDKLSTARAKEVYAYLVNKGIDTKQLSFRGYGKRRRVASDATVEGRAKNQRVEVKVVDLG